MTLASKSRRENQQSQIVEDNETSSVVVDVTMEHAPLYQSRLGELKAKAFSIEEKCDQKASSNSDDFFEKLRAKSLKSYDEKIKENRIMVDKNIAN